MCEDECEWYHPECIGFGAKKLDAPNIAFVCPMCNDKTRLRLVEAEKKGKYTKIESGTKKNFFVFMPKESAARNH